MLGILQTHISVSLARTHIRIALVALLSSACISIGQQPDTPAFIELDPAEAREMVGRYKGDDTFVILDTRTTAEFEKSHLAGAVFLNYNAEDYWDQVGSLDKSKVYLVYCHSGGRSGKTVEFMKQSGFTEAHNLKGGIVAWKREGYEVIRE